MLAAIEFLVDSYGLISLSLLILTFDASIVS